MVAEIIGVYAIDLKSNPSYDSINSSLQEIFDKHPQPQMYHSRICKILLDHFPDHVTFPSEADNLTVDDIVAPLAGADGMGKLVKLFYLLFDDNIWCEYQKVSAQFTSATTPALTYRYIQISFIYI